MNYVEILKQILEVETMENAYCNFISEIVEKGSTLSTISTYELEKIVSFLAKEQPTEYQIEKRDFSAYYYLKDTVLTRVTMDRYQNKVCYVEDYDDGDSQILVGDSGSNLQVWLVPLFFKEFYKYCVEVLDGIEHSSSVQNTKEKKNKEEKKYSVNNFCDIIAKDLLNDMDMLNNLIENMVNLGASDDQIIKTISMILKNRFNE